MPHARLPHLLPLDRLSPVLAKASFIAPTAVITGDVELAAGVSVWYGAVLRGDSGRISVEAETNIQDGAIVHGETSVGRRVTIGHAAVVHGCSIGDDTLIGMGAIVLSGARVGTGAIVAAGAVVREQTVVTDGMLVAGVPAKPVRMTTELERKAQHEGMRDYLDLARLYATHG